MSSASDPTEPGVPENSRSTPERAPTWMEVLEFVRDQSDKEVKGIERLFERAVKYFGRLVLAAAIVATFFGFSTYISLRDQVSAATNAEAQKANRALTEQIEQISKRENLEALVRQVLKDKTEAQLQELIAHNVAARVQSAVQSAVPTIVADAKEETRRQLAASNAPRILTESQRTIIAESLRSSPGGQVIVKARGPGEQQTYAKNLLLAIEASPSWRTHLHFVAPGSWESITGPEGDELGLSTGIVIVVDDLAHPPDSARQLEAALKSAGVPNVRLSICGCDYAPKPADVWLYVLEKN